MRPLVHLLALCLALVAASVRAEPLTLKIAANVPTGSLWHAELKRLATQWKDMTGGEVTLIIYVAGAMGDEADIVKKLRNGQLHGAALSSEGLHAIAPDAVALDLPMLFTNNTEYDAVAAKVLPLVDVEFTAKGFVPLAWTHVGWLHLFSTTARPSLATASASKLWVPSFDSALEQALKAASFRPVLLPYIDIQPSLVTGLIDAVPATPVIALALRLHDKARFMLDLPLASQSAALIFSKDVWDKVPPAYKTKLQEAARTTLTRMTSQARANAAAAVTKMKSQAMTVTAPEDVVQWSTAATALRVAMRGKWIPESTFDAVTQALAALRAPKP